MKEYEDCVDVQPLIIHLFDKKWYNPFIKEWFSPNDEQSEYDDDVWRMYFTNQNGDNMAVYFKSDYIKNKLNQWSKTGNWDSDNEDEWPNNNTLFKDFVDTQKVFDCLCLMLIEDFWSPCNPDRTKYDEQFCFSEFGEEVSKFFEVGEIKMHWFSLDCGLTTNGKDWWCDS